jgi:nucleoside-diphosphate-sugar epimerase
VVRIRRACARVSELCHSAESVYVDVGWFVSRQVMAPMCTGLFFAYKCVHTSHLATDLRFQIRLVTGSPNPDLTCTRQQGICRRPHAPSCARRAHEMTRTETVLVTGGTGFVGSHVVKAFINAGHRVRTTVRDAGSEKAAFLREAPWAAGCVEVVAADLMDEETRWRDVIRGCTVVVHTAAPNTTTEARAEQHGLEVVPKGQEEEFFNSRSIEGTARVVRAAIAEGVRRVVFTSTFAAIGFGHSPDPLVTPPGPGDATWTNLDGVQRPWDACTPLRPLTRIPHAASDHPALAWLCAADPVDIRYVRAKTLAERRAFELVDGTTTSLATVCPVQIYGPLLSRFGGDASMILLRSLLSGETPAVPNFPCAVVDVRDVAALHVHAACSDTAAGQRFLACAPPAHDTSAPQPMIPEVRTRTLLRSTRSTRGMRAGHAALVRRLITLAPRVFLSPPARAAAVPRRWRT